MNEREALRHAFLNNPKARQQMLDLLLKSKLAPVPREDDGPVHIVCKRWPGLVAHCTMALCSKCGAAIAVTPTSQELVKKSKEVSYNCAECFQGGNLDVQKPV